MLQNRLYLLFYLVMVRLIIKLLREVQIFDVIKAHLLTSFSCYNVYNRARICVLLLGQQLCQGYIVVMHVEEINLFNKYVS